MKYLLIAAALICLCLGCYTPNKADKAIKKASEKYPGKLANACQKSFPCITVKADTIYKENTEYDFIEIECPENGEVKYIKIHDTIQKIVVKPIVKKSTVTLPKDTIFINQYIVD